MFLAIRWFINEYIGIEKESLWESANTKENKSLMDDLERLDKNGLTDEIQANGRENLIK